MSKTMILVAAVTLAGGTKAKDGPVKPFEAAPGTELTDKVLAALGLDDAAVAELISRGSIAEVDVRAAAPETADDSELVVKLTAETKRADDAETKVKELETKLAAATKTAAQ